MSLGKGFFGDPEFTVPPAAASDELQIHQKGMLPLKRSADQSEVFNTTNANV